VQYVKYFIQFFQLNPRVQCFTYLCPASCYFAYCVLIPARITHVSTTETGSTLNHRLCVFFKLLYSPLSNKHTTHIHLDSRFHLHFNTITLPHSTLKLKPSPSTTIFIYYLSLFLFVFKNYTFVVCLSVCLCPMSVITTEPINTTLCESSSNIILFFIQN